jgi:hypothetical protein
LHHPNLAADHEPAGELLRDRSRECGAGQGERAADRYLRTRLANFEIVDLKPRAETENCPAEPPSDCAGLFVLW